MDKRFKIILRYILVLAIGFSMAFFSTHLTNATTNFSTSILALFSKTTVQSNSFSFNSQTFKIIPSCAAISAYFLLFFLSLSFPLKLSKRMLFLTLNLSLFFLINNLRIVLLVLIAKTPVFNTLHWITWHITSGISIFLIFIFSSRILRINSIPIITDLREFT